MTLGNNGSFTHDTHPDDRGFMKNGNTPGSAGETEIDFVNMGTLGILYQHKINSFDIRFEIGGVLANGRKLMQNLNDTRPPENGAFVYSEVSGGFYGLIGLSYNFESVKGLSIGADAQIMSLGIEHGYNRYGKDEKVESKNLSLATIAPKVEFDFGDGLIAQASVPIGTVVGFQFKIVKLF